MDIFFDHQEQVAPGIITFWFRPERPIQFDAGQYVDMYLPHEHPDSRGIRRTMSLSSSPTEPLLGITTTVESQGGSTFKQTLLRLMAGDKVMITPPMGDCVLPKMPSIPLVFVAAGVGITPVRSIVKWLLDTGEQRQVQLVYIARSPKAMPYLPLLRSYKNLQFISLYTQAAPSGMRAWRPSAEDLLQLIGDTSDKLIYLSGPQPMIEGFWYDLQRLGLSRDQLVLDYFTGYSAE